MVHSYFFLEFEIFLLFSICYIIFLHLCTKIFNFKLSELDFLLVCVLFLVLFLKCAIDNVSDSEVDTYLLNSFVIYGDLIRLLKTLMVLFFFIYIVIIYNFNMLVKIPIAEYLILIFLCFFSLVMIIESNHLFVIFLFLEIVNICLYCLIGMNKNSNRGIEAAYKYFMQSSFATILGFFAISLMIVSIFISILLLTLAMLSY